MNLSDFRKELSEALAEGGTQTLVRLTDEELTVLDPLPPESSIVSTPHLSGMEAEQREWVLATALRSLVSREIVEIVNIKDLDALERAPGDAQCAQVDMRIRPEVDLALTLRRTSEKTLALRQETSSGTAYAYVHIHDVDLLLVERVTSGGLHLFTLANTTREAAALLHPFIDPFGIADRDGPEQSLDPDALDRNDVGPLADVIDHAHAVSHLVLLREASGPMVMTYATSAALWVVTVEAPHAPTGIVARPVSTETLVRLITDLLS